ncbi:MAG: amidohydrolase family protein, partial [Candidatus Bipolaricaulia bacterium]
MRILLKNFAAITLAKAEGGILENVSIAIDSGKIIKIARDLDELPPRDYDRVIDGEGRVVIPGLVNAHTHAAMTLLRGYADDLPLMRWLGEGIWKAERKLTPEDVYWASLLAAIEMIRSGTTSFADMYFFMDEVAQAVEESGMRALLAWGVVSPEVSPEASEPEKELGKAIDLVERWDGHAGGRIKTAFAPHSAYSCSEELLERIVRLAKEHDTRIHIHIAETRDEVEEIQRRKGLSPVRFLDQL